jgi:hypothetical protein
MKYIKRITVVNPVTRYHSWVCEDGRVFAATQTDYPSNKWTLHLLPSLPQDLTYRFIKQGQWLDRQFYTLSDVTEYLRSLAPYKNVSILQDTRTLLEKSL